MEKEQIKKKMSHIKTPAELLGLINEIKSESEGDNFKPIDSERFFYFINPKRTEGRYVSFKIPKKRKGEFRLISAPKHELKAIQNVLKIILEAFYEPNTNAMGFVHGRSVVDNAMAHLRQNYVLNLDLKDFFPSVSRNRISKCLQLKPMLFTEEVARAIAGLCSIMNGDETCPSFVLPQGAPTSPVLTNIVCRRMDKRLNHLANNYGLNYTRYADDMTFSSKNYVYSKEGRFILQLQEIITSEGFVLNEAKTRLQKNGERKEVTGLVVSDRANVTRKYIREIRSLLYMWERYGYDVAYSKFYPYYKLEKGHVKKGEPSLENVLSGKLLYLKMVKGEKNNTYLKLKDRFNNLLNPVINVPELPKENSLKYIVSFKLDEFIKSFKIGGINFYINNNNHLQAKCDVIGSQVPRVILVSHHAEEEFQEMELKKGLNDINKTAVNSFYIALCENKFRKHFWLIMPNAPVTISDSYELTSHGLIEKWEKEGMSAAEKAYREQRQYINVMPEKIDPHKLIDIWEEKGLDAAISTYLESKTQISDMEHTNQIKDDRKRSDEDGDQRTAKVYDFSDYNGSSTEDNILKGFMKDVNFKVVSNK